MEKLDTLLETLKKRRDAVMERGVRLVDTTRDRGLDTLGSIRSGALDWHETLSARRSELEQRGPKWLGFTRGLQLVVIDRFDRALVSFGDRVRSEIQRLSQLELASSPADAAAKPTKRSEAADAKPSKNDGARRVSAAPSARAAKSASAKAPSAKAAGAKAPSAKAAGASAEAKTKATKAKPARARATKAKAKKAKASATEPSSNRSSTTRRLMMPIADYDSLNAKEIVGELASLSTTQCQTLFEHESANKNRQTVLKALAARLDS